MAIVLTAIMVLSHIAANAQRFRVLSHHERDSIIALLPKMPDNEEKLGNLYTISRNHEMMDSIIYYSMKAYHLAKQLNNPDYVAATCVVIGWYYNTIGKYAIAPKYFNEAGDIYESRKDSKGQAMMLSSCGDSYIGMRKFEQGLSYKLKALSIFAYTDDLASTAQIYRTIGLSCTQVQQYDSASEYLDKALSNDLTANNKQGIERDYYYIALTLQMSSSNAENDNQQTVKDYLQRALQLQEEINDNIFASKSCALLSLLYNYMYLTTMKLEYADSSYLYYHKGRLITDQTNYHGDDDIYHIASAEHQLISGNYITATQMMQQQIDNPSQSPITLSLLNQALQLSFKYNENYESLFELSQRLERDRKRI